MPVNFLYNRPAEMRLRNKLNKIDVVKVRPIKFAGPGMAEIGGKCFFLLT